MDKIVLTLFVLTLIPCLVYPTYVVLGILLRRKLPVTKRSCNAQLQPVSIIVVGYNEEKYIRKKIQSILDRDEWISGSELIVVSGGSTDRTSEIIREFENHPDVKVFLFEDRVTKIDGVNLAVAHSQHDILMFSDCRQRMKPGSFRRLAERFTDESIGTVTSTLCDQPVEQKSSILRSLLNEVAIRESRSGSSLNVFGALYAQRKSVYREIPRDILFDDLFVTVSTINQGKRLVQEKEAVIYDVPFDAYYGGERIERLARGLLIFLHRHAVSIRQLPLSAFLRFITYKYLKLAIPFLLPVLIASGIYIIIAMLNPIQQIVVATSIVLGTLIPEVRNFITIYFRVNYFFAIAVLKFYFRNERSIAWNKLEVVADSRKAA